MRNVFLIQLETKIALTIIAIVAIAFLFLVYKSVNDFNRFIEQTNIINEEIRVQKNP